MHANRGTRKLTVVVALALGFISPVLVALPVAASVAASEAATVTAASDHRDGASGFADGAGGTGAGVIGIVATGVSVSCQSGYFACCNPGSAQCYQSGTDPLPTCKSGGPGASSCSYSGTQSDSTTADGGLCELGNRVRG